MYHETEAIGMNSDRLRVSAAAAKPISCRLASSEVSCLNAVDGLLAFALMREAPRARGSVASVPQAALLATLQRLSSRIDADETLR